MYLGDETSLQAEAKALLIGLKLCVQRGFIDNLIIESDSMMLVRILLEKCRCPWSVRGEVEQILQTARGCAKFTHCYWEANKEADVLSNEGCAIPDRWVCIYERIAELLSVAKGAYRLDKLAFRDFRRCRVKSTTTNA